MPEKRLQGNIHQLSLRITKEMYNAIAELASESERTITDQIRFMLKKSLEITQNK